MNYYKLLGVSENADAATIKAAFRKLAKKYHPDTNQGNLEAEKMFKDINEAYSVLSDETKRKDYDESLHSSTSSNRVNSNSGKTQQQKKTANNNPFSGFSMKFDFDDIMGAGMNYEKDNKQKNTNFAEGQPEFLNFNQQFANFFGFNPKKK